MIDILDDRVRNLMLQVEKLLMRQTILEAEVRVIEEFLKSHY